MQTLPAESKTSVYDKLPRRLKRFVDQYVIGGTAASAIQLAGYKGRYPHGVAHKWLKKPMLRAAVEEATERHLADVGVRQVTVLRQMHAIATSDIAKLFNEDGTLKQPHELDEATRAAIASFEVEEVSTGGREGTRYKYKFWDKVKANDRLGQFVKLWEARATNVNVDARSVTINAGAGAEEAIRALADIGRQIAALGAGEITAPADQDRSVLPAEICDGEAGHRTPVDGGEDQGSTELP